MTFPHEEWGFINDKYNAHVDEVPKEITLLVEIEWRELQNIALLQDSSHTLCFVVALGHSNRKA